MLMVCIACDGKGFSVASGAVIAEGSEFQVVAALPHRMSHSAALYNMRKKQIWIETRKQRVEP